MVISGARGRVTRQIHPWAESEETRSFWKSLVELAGPQGGHKNGSVRHNKKNHWAGGIEYRKIQSVKRTQWQHLAPDTRGLEDEFPFWV